MRIWLSQVFSTAAVLLAFLASSWAQVPDANVHYRLSTQFRGTDLSLDVFNGGPKNNLTHLDRFQNVSGQFWRLTPNGDGTYRLSTEFRGPNVCLDIFNGGRATTSPT